MFNPIEECFSVVKNRIRKALRLDFVNRIQSIGGCARGDHNKMVNQIVGDALELGLRKVTPDLVKKLYKNMMSYCGRALELKNL
jgi:hypothetical protein